MQERNSRNKATRSPEGLALVASWLEETSHLTRPPVEDFLRDDDTLRSLRNVSGFLSAESNPRAGLNGTASSAARSLQEPSLSSPEAAAERAAPPLTNHTNASTPTYRPQPGDFVECPGRLGFSLGLVDSVCEVERRQGRAGGLVGYVYCGC